jgi:hypothetical protein
MGGTVNARRGDIEGLIDPATSINEQYTDDTTDIDGAGVDTAPQGQEYNGVSFFVDNENGNASDDLTFTVQESSDDGASDSYADLTDKDGNTVTGQVTGADSSVHISLTNAPKHERYLRVKLKSGDATLGGASSDVTAVALRGAKKVAP